MTRPDRSCTRRLLPRTLGLGLLVLAVPVLAQEAVITADRALFRQEAGTGVYEGNAEMVQGQRQVNADRIELRLQDGDLARIEATGAPVRLREGTEINARANRLVYDVAARTITLSGDAYIEQGGRRFEGAEVTYNLASRDIEASGDGGDRRVRLVIPAEDTNRESQ